ncbi:MAG: nuclear transport factor 2 family protein [Bacteroidetes bacterium]|nr:nuclear transport factor 2 family protein [Bacteroidota bacterium]
MSYQAKAQELYAMIGQGQSLEALDKFYHDNVTVTEVPRNEVRNGKEAQRAAIQQWFEMVESHNGGGVKSITSNEEEGITAVESWMDMTLKGGMNAKMSEVAVQKWDGDKIIEEKFYYHDPQANMG